MAAVLDRTAVLAEMGSNAAVRALGPELIVDAKFDRAELTLTVAPESVREAARAVQAAGYNFAYLRRLCGGWRRLDRSRLAFR